MTDDARGQLEALIAAVQDGRGMQEAIDASPLAMLVANDAGSFLMTNQPASTRGLHVSVLSEPPEP